MLDSDLNLLNKGQTLDTISADKFDNYKNNSAVFGAQNITTPLLIMVGKKDDVVSWTQSLEIIMRCADSVKRQSCSCTKREVTSLLIPQKIKRIM